MKSKAKTGIWKDFWRERSWITSGFLVPLRLHSACSRYQNATFGGSFPPCITPWVLWELQLPEILQVSPANPNKNVRLVPDRVPPLPSFSFFSLSPASTGILSTFLLQPFYSTFLLHPVWCLSRGLDLHRAKITSLDFLKIAFWGWKELYMFKE